MRFKLIALIISIIISFSSQATTITKTFPSLKGTYNFTDNPRSVSFDLGVQFSSITSVSVKLTSVGTYGLLQTCDISLLCFFSPFPPEASYTFGSENTLGSTINGRLTIGNLTGSVPSTTSNLLGKTNLFLDGRGTFSFGHQNPVLSVLQEIANITPFFEVSDITLIIKGTIISNPRTVPIFLPALLNYYLE